MGATPRREVTRRREELAWDLRLRGHSLAEIGARIAAAGLGAMTPQAVHAALGRVERRVLEGLTDRATTEKARQLDALTLIYHEAMQAWAKSQEPSRAVRRRTVHPPQAGPHPQPAAAGRQVTVTEEAAERPGDVAYLRAAMEALADLRKLLGLDTPAKVKLGGLEGAPIAVAATVAPAARADAELIRGLTSEQLRELDAACRRITGALSPSDLAGMGRDQ
jgi:hypothetical protein